MAAIDITSLKLPAVSQHGLKVLDMVSGEDVQLLEIARIISQDPVLSGTVLKYANAPLYRRMVEVTNVRNAISMLGIKNVRLAVVVATMRSLATASNPVMERLWDHSFRIATLAKLLALRCCRALADDIELTALVHDLGALVLVTNYTDKYEKLLAQPGDIEITELERRTFGVTRGEVILTLAQGLRLPEVTYQALARFFGAHPGTAAHPLAEKHLQALIVAHHLERRLPLSNLPRESTGDETAALAVLGLDQQSLEDVLSTYKTKAGPVSSAA